MTHELFSILTRRASPSLMGIAEATAQTKPITANARKNKRKNGDVNKRCKQQAEEWGALISPQCPGNVVCEEILACSTAVLSRCDFSGFLDCLFGELEDPADAVSLR
jgi:hypothetical protein